MNAHNVHVTTKQPCKQSANKLSLVKKKNMELLQRTPKETKETQDNNSSSYIKLSGKEQPEDS